MRTDKLAMAYQAALHLADILLEAARILEDAGVPTRLLCDYCGRPIGLGAFPLNSAQSTEPRPLEVCWVGNLPEAA